MVYSDSSFLISDNLNLRTVRKANGKKYVYTKSLCHFSTLGKRKRRDGREVMEEWVDSGFEMPELASL